MTESIGKMIQRLRTDRGWTQYDLGCRLGDDVHQNSVSNWERGGWALGGPRNYFDRLCKAFDYPSELLIWWADTELAEVEQTAMKVQELKAELVSRKRPGTAVDKLEELISQNRKMLADLEELRRELVRGEGMVG